MKKRFMVLLFVALLLPAFGYAQDQLPPGTQAPDDAPAAVLPPAPSPEGKEAASASHSGVSPELAEAENRIEQGDFAGARPLVEKSLARRPGDARALFDLGYLEQASHHDQAAEEEYRKAVAADPKQFEARLALGLILAKRGKTEEAKEQLLKATLLSPAAANPEAQAQAFRALAELERSSDPEEARDNLLSALRLTPETPADLLLTAEIAEGSGDSETAEAAYRRLLAEQPAPSLVSAANAGLGHLLLQQKKYGDAESLLQSSLANDPENPSLNAELATTLIAEGKNQQALPVLEKLRQLEPANTAVKQMLADAYSDAGYPKKADPIYAELAQEQPGDEEALAGQGRNLIRERNYPQAQRVLERAVKLSSSDGEAWTGLAVAASENGQYSTVIEALSMRAKYLPETATSYFLWADSYDNLHQKETAEKYYRKFLQADGGKFPDQDLRAKQRLAVLAGTH